MILAVTVTLMLPSAVDIEELERRIQRLEERLDEIEERGTPPDWNDWLRRDWLPNLSQRLPKVGMPGLVLGSGTWLGVELGELSADEAQEAGVRWGEGVAIRKVVPGSPAERAGLEDGDVILSIDGEPVGSADAVARMVRSHEPGDGMSIEISRNGVRSEVATVLGERGTTPPAILRVEPRTQQQTALDVSRFVLTDELAERMDLTEEERANVEKVLEAARREIVEEISRRVNRGEGIDFGDLSVRIERLERDVENKLSQMLSPKQVEEYRRSLKRKAIQLELEAEED